MTIIYKQIQDQLNELNNTITQLDISQISQPLHYLHNATLGQHVRHILEMLQCLLNGYESGCIDYINRTRNLNLESNKTLVLETIQTIKISFIKPNKDLKIKITEMHSNIEEYIETNFERELLWQLDHIIHHLAMFKVGLIELNIPLENNFLGVAYSTMQYKKGH
ncbi:MAG: DinB family protein [Alphaproteobacteria bacterium]|nr:DinB family protein [Alphaproteobacteria bacterium]